MQTLMYVVAGATLVTAGLLACYAWYHSKSHVRRRADERAREEHLAAARRKLWDDTQP